MGTCDWNPSTWEAQFDLCSELQARTICNETLLHSEDNIYQEN